MKLTATPLAVLAAFALAVPAFAAATVSYSHYTATGQSDTSWVNVTGYDSIVAGNVGGSATTSFGSVDWLPMTAGNVSTTANGVQVDYRAGPSVWATIHLAFYAGGPSLLNHGGYTSNLQTSGVEIFRR